MRLSDLTAAPATWNDSQVGQTESVDQLIRRAHVALEAAGVLVSPSKVSRRIRARVARDGHDAAERMIAGYAAISGERGSFDAYCLTYIDSTGETAVRNLMAASR